MDRLRNDKRFSQQRLDELTASAKASLSPEQFEKLSEEDLARFIVARDGNVDAALKQLHQSLDWYENVLGDKQECKLCEEDPTCHSHVPIGMLDEEGEEASTIFYGCPARATHTAVDPTVHHVAHQLEYCHALPETGSRWIWCVDYNGFGLSHAMQSKLATKIAALLGTYMPGRLHKIFLLNPPKVFRIMLKVVKPFVDQRTMDCVVPVTGPTEKVLQILRDEHSFPSNALQFLEQALNQKLPNKLPPLPHQSKNLLLPSLVPHFDFVDTPAEM